MTPDRDYCFKLNDDVSAAGLDAFCDGSQDFLQLPRLLSKFKDKELDYATEAMKLLRHAKRLKKRQLNQASMLQSGILKNRVLHTCCNKDPKNTIFS